MLNFLRRYQKIFFIIITGIIIISFCFFGTYGTLGQAEKVPDKEVTKGVCGKPIMQHELMALQHLLQSSYLDILVSERRDMPNFFNNGVIEKDFIASGLGAMLLSCYYDDLKEDLEARLNKIRHFQAYVHPESHQISVELLWSKAAPDFFSRYQQLKTKKDLTQEQTISLLTSLYLDQFKLSPYQLKRMLLAQQKQLGVSFDPVLQQTDLALFGFRSLEDWFGPRFISLAAQCILNAAQIAQEKGYVVGTEEVRADLYANIYQAYQGVMQKETLTNDELERYYQNKMRSFGLDETLLVEAWKSVMLFRRLFDDGSSSVLIDPLVYRQFDDFAKQNAHVTIYQLPQAFQLKDFREVMKLQVYLEAIAEGTVKDLRFPEQFASVDQIEKRCPELVQRDMHIQWKAISKEQLSQDISIKETEKWECRDENWEILVKNFAEIKSVAKEQRLAYLNGLDEEQRFKIDQFARFKMLDGQIEKIQTAFAQAPVNNATIGRSKKLPFPGKIPEEEVFALIQQASLSDQAPNQANQRLHHYSGDGIHFLWIDVLSREDAKKVLTFERAQKEGILDQILDKRLEEAYADVRRKFPQSFQQTNGGWKPFTEVKDLIGKYVFSDLLKSIEQTYLQQFGFLPGKEGELPLKFYSNARMLNYMQEALVHLKKSSDDANWLKDAQKEHLGSQWLLEKMDQTLQRSTHAAFSKEDMFTLDAQQWSTVKLGENGALAFYFVHEKADLENTSCDGVFEGHQILSYDAKKDIMIHLVKSLQSKNAIDLKERQ